MTGKPANFSLICLGSNRDSIFVQGTPGLATKNVLTSQLPLETNKQFSSPMSLVNEWPELWQVVYCRVLLPMTSWAPVPGPWHPDRRACSEAPHSNSSPVCPHVGTPKSGVFRGKLIRYSVIRDGMWERLTRALGYLQPELKMLGPNSYQERENGAKS